MASIVEALRRIKQDPLGVIKPAVVKGVCEELRYEWRSGGELDPATAVALFVQQIVHGNTPCSEVRHLAGQELHGFGVVPGASPAAAGGVPGDAYAGM